MSFQGKTLLDEIHTNALLMFAAGLRCAGGHPEKRNPSHEGFPNYHRNGPAADYFLTTLRVASARQVLRLDV
jgi:hypothetical protein